MNECDYKYSVDDNLAVSREVLKKKNQRKTNIVSLLILFCAMFGVLASIGAIIQGNNNWWIGILSVALVVGYFLVDVVALNIQLKKQREYFFSSKLKDITRVKVTMEDDKIDETFYKGNQEIGVNHYNIANLTSIKLSGDYIFLFFDQEYGVLLKKQCMTNKTYLNYLKLREKFIKIKKNVIKKKK